MSEARLEIEPLPPGARAFDQEELAPHVRRLKERLHAADYEICLHRALCFTEVYRETESLDPGLRNALSLRRTLERQRIVIQPDERMAGSKTERFLSTPLPVERGDFSTVLQLELDVLEHKQRPFIMSAEDKRRFREEILPYWNGRTLHDDKARRWAAAGLVSTRPALRSRLQGWLDHLRWARYLGRERLGRIAGAGARAPLTRQRLRDLWALRHELAHTQPTPAVYCMDVQGHLCLGVDRVVELGMDELVRRTSERLERLRREQPEDRRSAAFLEAVRISLEAAMAYAERFAALAEEQASASDDTEERRRLMTIAKHCRRVPREPARSFHEALQSAWMAQVVAEIQFGTMDVFAVGRVDQFLAGHYHRDLETGRLQRGEAMSLLQEYFLKLSANVSPIPELGMEGNGVLGNSQHPVTIGGLTPEGLDGTNDLSELILDAYEQMGGAVNQLCVRLHPASDPAFVRRACAVFRLTNGIAFYNDSAVVEGLIADGMAEADARDYTVVGCVESCGHSNMQGCVAGHDLVLPAVLLLTLSNGSIPPRAPGQQEGFSSGSPESFGCFDDLLAGFERQLAHQLDTLIRAVAEKDLAHREILPAPYVSALIDGCIDRAADITAGGALYDFTSIDVRGLGTTLDSLLAIEWLVFQQRELSLDELWRIVLREFDGHEVLRQRLLRLPPKHGRSHPRADALMLDLVSRVHRQIDGRRNIRGGRYRLAYFSLGNHVIDGIFLGATPDGRLGGSPISNGVSPSDGLEVVGAPHTIMRSVAKIPPAQVSSGIALNMRFHPHFIEHERGLGAFADTLRTYFARGGMHLQPNVVSVDTLRAAQRHPERYRDLVVKVSGYSACFTDLGRSIQEDIIARAEYGAGS